MSDTDSNFNRAEPQPLPDNMPSTQPGGGVCYSTELAWGRCRRWYLKRFRRGYVERMAKLRLGDTTGAPHEIIDPRDLKFCRNRCKCGWAPSEDPFRWRQRLPMARWGLAELQLMGWPLLLATVLTAYWCWYLAVVPGVCLGLVVYFFRDPLRRIPDGPGVMVSPADGKVCEITHLDNHEMIGGPAVRIGIFLSIFNVHINRAPELSRVISVQYSPGKFLNALKPESALVNENTLIELEEETPPHRKMVVRQISGAIARRIVCDIRPGEVLARGEKFGMIKLGSRTELIIADNDELSIEVKIGQRIKAGSTIMARYKSRSTPE
jgi:phosphatidylserine decarboxylase